MCKSKMQNTIFPIVEITTDDGKTYSAKVIGSDPRTDIALIKVEGRNDFP